VSLRVERPPDEGWKRQLAEARAENAELLRENQMLEITNQIHRLDRAWEARRRGLMVSTKTGKREPSVIFGFLMLVGGCLLMLWGLWTWIFMRGNDTAWVGLFGFALLIPGIVDYTCGKTMNAERRRYLCKRQELSRSYTELAMAAGRHVEAAYAF
jgi:hypothetical protein